jgi:hypothetical protein
MYIHQQVEDVTVLKNGAKMRRIHLQDGSHKKVVVKLWNDAAETNVHERDRVACIGFEVEQKDAYPVNLNWIEYNPCIS